LIQNLWGIFLIFTRLNFRVLHEAGGSGVSTDRGRVGSKRRFGRLEPGRVVHWGTDTGIELLRPRAGLMSSGDSWPKPRGDRPSRLLEPDSWRRPWRRWPRRGDDVVLQSGDPPTASSFEARSDLAEGVVGAEGAAAPFNCQDPSLQDRIIL
jgi:hypothetical protein